MIGIYIIQNIENKKLYVGATTDWERRQYQHRNSLSNNKHSNKHLQKDWNDYGEKSFAFIFLLDCTPEQLKSLEKQYIDNCKDNMYNIYTRSPFGLSIKKKEPTSRNIGQRWTRKSKGYYYDKSIGKYRAQIRIEGIKTNLGAYNTAEEARRAYLEAKEVYHK
jgi:group I intron endonuclease